MIRPFKGMFSVTQEWGINPLDYARFGLKGHNGVDYGTPTGTPIIAPHKGEVIEASWDPMGYGMYVKIENDVEGSILAHLESFNVNPGDVLTEGTQIGISNNTGNSTGPHLHWGYYRKPRNKADGYSGTTNPYLYLTEINEAPDYKKLYEDALRKIEDLQATEKRLQSEKEALQKDFEVKLAECKINCYIEVKQKIINLLNNI